MHPEVPVSGQTLDPLDPAFVADPVPVYARLREQAPVTYCPRWDFWILLSYRDIVAAATRPAVFSSEWGITVPPNPVSGRRAPMHFDPPEHTRIRRAMNAPFRETRLLALEPYLRETARELLSELLLRPDGDFVRAYTSPLASLALGALLGLSREQATFLDVHSMGFEDAQFRFDSAAAEKENLLLYEFARKIVADRRQRSLDPDDDVVSALLAHVDGADGLDDEFASGSLRQLFIAAHVAPRVALAAAIAHLGQDEDLQARLRAEPHLIGRAAEELLRLHTPNQGFSRTLREDVLVDGQLMRAGQRVAFAYPSANRDPAVFTEPDDIDLQRRGRGHLTFGSGAHKCIGATLARLELVVAMSELLAATTRFSLSRQPEMIGWPLTGPADLYLVTEPARSAG